MFWGSFSFNIIDREGLAYTVQIDTFPDGNVTKAAQNSKYCIPIKFSGWQNSFDDADNIIPYWLETSDLSFR